ncbi:Yip1 member 6 [Cyanidiococcus yangmingshanensis]|uniref:Yip1 member 6 n=1 Tax=Cyanidiococcus yangmingshanensis TaxID=2690220 RepID=A0A7J7IG07_9RHOD|nr:Yip1 member 6 [Cyanidiococcus yangmingshanensis]
MELEDAPVYVKRSVPWNTLDERTADSILRDLRVIAKRARLVALPCRCTSNRGLSLPEARSRAAEVQAELHDWDLWGPLLVCLALSATLSAVSRNAPVNRV